jgi:phage terminase large subunit-like protein
MHEVAWRRLMFRRLGRLPPAELAKTLGRLSAADRRAFGWDWGLAASEQQREPAGDWRVWLMLAGRGFGKTRTGAEWVLAQARTLPEGRIALVGGSIDEVARVMIEGESGLLASAPPGEKLDWCISRSELRFPSGAIAHAFSGAYGERLRGPQHHVAWADELGKWRDADRTWDNLMLGLRLGERPRVVVTTTPGNGALLKRIQAGPGVRQTAGRTFDNIHLPRSFLDAMEAAYGSSRLGRQELGGELLGEADGALWTRDLLERRRTVLPDCAMLVRVVVGVDPPASATGDACGIVVCARLADGRGLVLADASVRGESPAGWARRVADAVAAWGADRVVAEANNGGQMVEEVLKSAERALPVKRVHARRGKVARAEPVAALFEAGQCWLAGHFPALEDELCAMTAGGYAGSGSPDRADAMVWAFSELMTGTARVPQVRAV